MLVQNDEISENNEENEFDEEVVTETEEPLLVVALNDPIDELNEENEMDEEEI